MATVFADGIRCQYWCSAGYHCPGKIKYGPLHLPSHLFPTLEGSIACFIIFTISPVWDPQMSVETASKDSLIQASLHKCLITLLSQRRSVSILFFSFNTFDTKPKFKLLSTSPSVHLYFAASTSFLFF